MEIKSFFAEACDLFIQLRDGDWYCGYYPDSNHEKFFNFYSSWYDGYHRALWIGNFTIAVSY